MIFIVRDDFFGKAKAIFKHMGVLLSPFLFTHSTSHHAYFGISLDFFIISLCLCDGDDVALLRSSRQFFYCHHLGVIPSFLGLLSTLMFQLPVRCSSRGRGHEMNCVPWLLLLITVTKEKKSNMKDVLDGQILCSKLKKQDIKSIYLYILGI